MDGQKYATICSLCGQSARALPYADGAAGAARAEWFAVGVFAAAMQLITILYHCHRFRGLVYESARFSRTDRTTIGVRVRPGAGSAAVCSGCQRPAAGYDHLPERRFEFNGLWGFLVFPLYRMRRVNCKTCGVVVEEVPWASGKRQLTKVHMQFLAYCARKLSWKETAEAFRTSWDKVCHSVEYVVSSGLEHRTLGPIRAIGVDEIQCAKGHKYLTLSLGKLPEPELTHEFFSQVRKMALRRNS